MAEDGSTDRTVVKTYVPRYQKDRWREEAEDLDMSHSEYVRSMVQAGRRGFDLDPVEGGSRDVDPGGESLKDRVLDVLRREGPLDWDELVDELTDDVEDRLEAALDSLQAEDRVRHSGRAGGYAPVDPDE